MDIILIAAASASGLLFLLVVYLLVGRHFSLQDHVVIAVLAALGLATKQVLYPLVTLVAVPLFLPAGSIAGGIYMTWLVVARGVVDKPWAALACALVQSFTAFLTPFGKHGAWTFAVYLTPGLMVELVMLSSGHSACCTGCAAVAGSMANMAGSAMVSYIILAAPLTLVALSMAVGGMSGMLAGPLAISVLRSYWRVFPREDTAVRAEPA